MSSVVIVPTRNDTFVVRQADTTLTLAGVEEVYDLISELTDPEIITVLGGPAQFLFFGVTFRDEARVHRVPLHRLYQESGLEAGASAEARAESLQALFAAQPRLFYDIRKIDEAIFLTREAARQRLRIQTDFRKKAAQQALQAERDLRFFLDPDRMDELGKLLKEDPEAYRKAIRTELRNTPAGVLRLSRLRDVFADPGIITGAKRDEERLEKAIKDLLGDTLIWESLHPTNDSPLLSVKGLGPALGGGLIGEILDIRRFPSAPQLRTYAGYGISEGGGMQRRTTGEQSNYSDYLRQVMWLWSADQVPKQGGVFGMLYRWAKLHELQLHPEVVPAEGTDRMGRPYTRYSYSLGHIDKRAKRRVASMLLEYVFWLWTTLETGEDPERTISKTSSLSGYAPDIREAAAHFRPLVDVSASWPRQVEAAERQMESGGYDQLAELVEARRARSEKEVDAEEVLGD